MIHKYSILSYQHLQKIQKDSIEKKNWEPSLERWYQNGPGPSLTKISGYIIVHKVLSFLTEEECFRARPTCYLFSWGYFQQEYKAQDITGPRVINMLNWGYEFVKLRALRLRYCKVVNLEGLTRCPRLEQLVLYYNTNLDLSTLPILPQLRTLNIAKCRIENLQSLERCSQLREFGAYGNPSLDLASLPFLRQLYFLNIGRCRIVSLKPLERCPHLRKIQAPVNRALDLRTLPRLGNLTSLNIMDCRIVNLKPLENCPRLQNIYAFNNPLLDIGSLPKLPKIRNFLN